MIPTAEPFGLTDEVGEPRLVFSHRTRIVILLLVAMTLSFVMANSLAFNFTMLCMYRKDVTDVGEGEPTDDDLMFDLAQRSWLLSAIAIGNFIGTLPFIKWSNARGIREAFTAFTVLSTAATGLTPMAARAGFGWLFGCRICQGISIGAAWPMMGMVTSEWSTLKLSGTYVAFLSCHLQMGSVLTMPLSGLLCDSGPGWPAVYYIQAACTTLFIVMFAFFFRDSPSMHRNVSSKELKSISKNKENIVVGDRPPTPYLRIFTDVAAWACIICTFSGNLGFQFLNQYGPTYLKTILHFDTKTTGFGTALPYVLAIVVKMVAGPLSDWMPRVSVRTRVLLFAGLSQFTMSAAYLLLAFMTDRMQGLAQALFTAAVVFSGLNCVGSVKSIQLISGPYVFVLMAINSLSSSFWVLVLPPIVRVMAPNESQAEWFMMFMVFGGYIVISTVFFMVFGQAAPREWAKANAISANNNAENDLSVSGKIRSCWSSFASFIKS